MVPRRTFRALILELLILAGLLVFSRGFLPPSRTKLGFATELPNVGPKFNRVVFMVVDAMRSDFVYSSSKSKMHNVHNLLRNGYGYAFTAYSDPPTVTLPRIKGLTTGSSPNFLDAVINIAESDSASTLQHQDSWIHQLSAQNKSLHMFGDDTWLKLFPNVFNQVDGTSSFYVADFTEVDNNVTRHLPDQLHQSASWDALVLHYLGLDHIGHKGGPNSIHMPQKLQEMDSIVQEIFDSLDESTLFVLAGDHGMNEVGNHGGASRGETSAAMVLLSKKFRNKIEAPLPHNPDYSYYSQIYQVDLVPTLAYLLGFPIPKNSLGVFIEDVLSMWESPKDKDAILSSNCHQLEIDVTQNIGSDDQSCTWDRLRDRQSYLMRTSSEYVVSYMIIGICFLVLISMACIFLSFSELRSGPLAGVSSVKWYALLAWWIIIPVLYFVGMLSSSTVEEEHYIWYWGLTGLLACLLIALPDPKDKVKTLALFACFRIIRGWNTAGQKWTHLPDSVDLINGRPAILWSLVISCFALVSFISIRRARYSIITIAASLAALLFKYYAVQFPLSLPWMINLARLAFGTAILDMVLGGGVETGSLILFIMETKLENIPVWMAVIIGRHTLVSLMKRPEKPNEHLIMGTFASLIVLCFEYACFFAMGGSNSLATIDLSNAYNGVSGYNIPLVGLLTYLGNWSVSLYWTMSLSDLYSMRILRATFYSISCTGIALACFILREHLFIWTVFSPKLLYVGAWLVFHEILATTFVTIAS